MAHTKLSEEEVAQVARLARLRLSPEALREQQHALQSILAYMERLETVDVEGVPATRHAGAEVRLGLRVDARSETMRRTEAFEAAPHVEAEAFAVPRVVDVD